MLTQFKTQICILIYLIFIIPILVTKCNFFYDNKGNLKQFGTGQGKTIIPLWLGIVLVALISVFLSNAIMLI
jgi:hypothetical protein